MTTRAVLLFTLGRVSEAQTTEAPSETAEMTTSTTVAPSRVGFSIIEIAIVAAVIILIVLAASRVGLFMRRRAAIVRNTRTLIISSCFS